MLDGSGVGASRAASAVESLKRAGRKIGLSRLRSWHRRARKVGTALAARESLCRFRYLRRILCAPPIPCHPEGVEVHMLLHHQRIYEGLWGLYSFALFARRPCRFVVHSDGSLTREDLAQVLALFPGARIVSRREADECVLGHLRQRGLDASARLRGEFVLALKMFDLPLFTKSASFIYFDSDVFFYDTPVELLEGLDGPDAVVQPSISRSHIDENYTLELDQMQALIGRSCFDRVNSGIIRAPRSLPDFEKIETYLTHPDMARPKRFSWFREQTCWAMEISRSGGSLLSDAYAVWGVPSTPGAVAGHFAGPEAPSAGLYTDALPYLTTKIVSAR